ncbi:phage tail spike protein [Paenibacillus sophorae]|uniref:phage tail spike protein n=1 Tax=Paenibacillus sophorae TaxID=1333845 RepID=UPI001C31972A|nr:phage tail spike protein [Paenibacillus sophorae]
MSIPFIYGGNMLGEIDFSKKPYTPSYFLARPDKEIISKLSEAYNDNLKIPVNETSKLSLSIPYLIDINHVLMRNKNIDLVKENYLIKMVFGKSVSWFTILEVNEVMSEDSNYKQITAYGLEIELAQRVLKGYKAESKGARTVLTEMLSETTWSIGDIDVDFELSKRSFEFLDNKLLGSIYDVANTYNAVVQFDTENQTVNFKKMELFGQDKGLTFSYESLLKSFDKKSDAKELVTRLYLEGKDGLTVNAISPTGQSYLEDYSYFMYPFKRDENKNVIEHSNYMSDFLCNAILDYQELVEQNKDQFQLLKAARDGYASTISTKNSELIDLQNQLKVIYNIVDNYQLNTSKIPTMFFENIEYTGSTQTIDFNQLQTMYPYAVMVKVSSASDVQISLNGSQKFIISNTWTLLGKVNTVTTSNVQITGNGNATVNIQVTAINETEYNATNNDNAIIERYCPNNKQMQIDVKNTEIAEQTGYLNSILAQITSLQTLLSSSNNFTPDQLIELQRFVKASTFKDDTYIDAEDLLKDGRKKFEEVRVPLLTIDVDVVYFLSVIEEQSKWDKLVIGDDVSIKYERIGVKVKAKIIEINYDFEGEKISLTLANVRNDGSAASQMLDYLKKYENFSTTIDANKPDWLKSVTDVSDMSLLFEQFWDKVTNQINMSINETVTIDNRGILLYDSNDPMRFLKLSHATIGMTKSGGQRYELGITPDGIVAEALYGKVVLSQRVVVGDADGVWLMEGPKTTITDRYGRVAMKLGLYEENPDLYGMIINRYDGYDINSTLINKVIANSEDGFKIQRWNGYSFDDVFSVDNNGYLKTVDMEAKSLKIVDKDNQLLLNSYTKEMNIGRFDNIITDGKLTAIEKLQVLGERTRIMSEYIKLLDQAEQYKTTSRDDTVRIDIQPFTDAYNNLIAYLAPLLSNMTETSDIDRDEFIQKFKDYYDQVVAIVNAINDSIKYSSVQLGSLYNGTIIDAINGVTVTRSDTMFRSVMNATRGFYLQRNTNTAENPNWVDLIWGDLSGVLHAEGLKLNSSFFTNGDITAAAINGSSITLRDPDGGVMKLFPGLEMGLWAGKNAENPTDAPTWLKMDGTLITKKLLVQNGVDGGLMIDSEKGIINFNQWSATGIAALDAQLISAIMVSADYGIISDIVAKSLSTMTRAAIADWSNFIEIKDKTIQWVTGRVNQGEHISVNGDLMYWVDSSQTGIMTKEVTAWPVYKYDPDDDNKKVKMEAGFNDSGASAQPYWRMGEGDGGIGNSGIARFDKYFGGLKIRYGSGNYDKERSIDFRDSGVYVISEGQKVNITSKDLTATIQDGECKIVHSSGSIIHMTPDGDIITKATRDYIQEAGRNMKWKAQSFDFEN